MTLYAAPGTEGSIVDYRERYDNYIGGQWVAPVDGEYMDNISPVNGEVFCQVARGKEADITWLSTPRKKPSRPSAKPLQPSAHCSCTA